MSYRVYGAMAVWNSPLALSALVIAALALLGVGLLVWRRRAAAPRDALWPLLGVVALCVIAVVAVSQGLAR